MEGGRKGEMTIRKRWEGYRRRRIIEEGQDKRGWWRIGGYEEGDKRERGEIGKRKRGAV